MALFGWLSKANPSLAGKVQTAKTPLLSDPNKGQDAVSRATCASANAEIDRALGDAAERTSSRKRAKEYHHYDDALRLKIGSYAQENGLTVAARRFTSELKHTVSVTTVQTMRDAYRKELAQVRDPAKILALPARRRGRPFPMPDDVDVRIRKHL